jgi:chromosome segregation ATPase
MSGVNSQAEVADLGNLDDFDAELQRLSAASRELLESLRGPAPAPSVAAEPESDELTLLRLENKELHARVEELEHLLQHAGSGQDWGERQREYEALLEEKSEVIRILHQKIRDLQEKPPEVEGDVPSEDDLRQMKKELDDQRRQLEEDEEAMVSQLRAMEMSLSRDRAEMARQRQEVQRLQQELTREIELAGRDPALRDRLNNLRRPSDRGKTPLPAAAPAAPPASPAEPAKKNSGLLRRIFG